MNATINPASGQPIAPEVLRAFATRVYRSAGVPEVEAQLAADTLVQADLWGHQSHGMLRLGWYYARLCSGAMKAVTHTTLEVDAGAIAVMDGHDGVGQVVTRRAVDEAVKRARNHGVGVVSIRNSNHFGTCMYYTRIAAEQKAIELEKSKKEAEDASQKFQTIAIGLGLMAVIALFIGIGMGSSAKRAASTAKKAADE